MIIRSIALAALLAAIPVAAQAATIDFNNLEPIPGTLYSNFSSYTQDGYTASASPGEFYGQFYYGYIYQTDTTPGIYGSGSSTLQITGPGLFSLTSFDAFRYYAGPDTAPVPYTVTGYKSGTSIYSKSGAIGAPPTGVIVTNPFVTFDGFGTDLFDRVDITLAEPGAYLDNIMLSPAAAVPEPASWAMMVGGFGVIGGAMRRRPTVAVKFA